MVKHLLALVITLCLAQLQLNAAPATKTVTGRVLDDSGAPLPGAVIKAVGKNSATAVCDANGTFKITVPTTPAVNLQVSYIGFRTETVILKAGATEHTIRLTPDAAALEQVVVTGTRTPKALKDAPVVTRLITADDIKKADATNIQDLLTEELPGLEFSYAMSQETSLNMNGFGGNAVLFLVDGERMAGETMDNVDYNRLNLDNVGRIEVVKGAASALYGANAVAGVVNIISRESSEPWTANVNTRYRSAGKEWRHGGSVSFNSGKWNSQTSVQYTSVETINLTDAFDTESDIHNIWGGNTLNAKERLVFKATDKLKLIARGGYFARESDRANYTDHYNGYSGGLKGMLDFGKGQNLELSYAYDQYDKARYVADQRTHDHDYSNRQHVAHALYNLPLGANTLTVGADYMHDYLTTYQFTDNGAKSQYSVDAFAQFDYNPAKWLNVMASLRHDYFSNSSASATTARLAAMLKWTGFSVRATYAGGFRAPTLKEMYMNFDMAGIQMIYGNPDLKPEKSHNWNVALEHYGKTEGTLGGSYSMTLTGYMNKYNRRITTTDFAGDDTREEGAIYCNEDGVTVSGIDFNVQYRSDMGLGLKASYNYLHTSGNTVESQFSQPRPHTATWRIDYGKQLCSAYGFNAAISGRFLSAPQTKLDTDGAYSLWKFTLQQDIAQGIRVNLIVDNLLNYRPKVYHWNSAPTTGTSWSLGVSLDLDKLI